MPKAKKWGPLTEEQQKLVAENHGLIFFTANRLGLDIEEYYDVLAIGLCRAAIAWDPVRGTFSTFAVRCMRSAYAREVNSICRVKRKSDVGTVSVDEIIFNSDSRGGVSRLSMMPDPAAQDALEAVEIRADIERYFEPEIINIGELFVAGYTSREITPMIGKPGMVDAYACSMMRNAARSKKRGDDLRAAYFQK